VEDLGPGRLRRPQQARSEQSLLRILEAVEELMGGRPFRDITIQEIVDLAEVSRSSFYARFPSKDDLLPYMYRRYVDRVTETLDAGLAVEPLSVRSDELIERLVRSYLDFVVRLEPMLVSFEAGDMGSRHVLTRDAITDRVVQLYLRAIGRTDDRELQEKVEFATRSIASILLRALCQPAAFATQLGFDHERLIAETTRMAECYLADAVR